MKNSIFRIVAFGLVACLSGCASTYKAIDPPRIHFNAEDKQNGIELFYRHGVLQEAGNRKYAKKEEKKGVRLIAVEITNNTDTVINIGRNAFFYSGNNKVFPLDPQITKETIGQVAPGYLAYLLLSLMTLNVQDGATVQSYPIGLIIGPGIAIGNVVAASNANKKLLSELTEYNVLNRDIQKGETVYGIIAIFNMGYAPISLRLVNEVEI